MDNNNRSSNSSSKRPCLHFCMNHRLLIQIIMFNAHSSKFLSNFCNSKAVYLTIDMSNICQLSSVNSVHDHRTWLNMKYWVINMTRNNTNIGHHIGMKVKGFRPTTRQRTVESDISQMRNFNSQLMHREQDHCRTKAWSLRRAAAAAHKVSSFGFSFAAEIASI